MRGVKLIGHGGPEMLVHDTDLPVPELAPTDVLIKVGAAGVNNTDINTRVGWYSKGDNDADDAAWTGTPLGLPRIQGIDAVGTITKVGSAVDPARFGERVLVEPCLYRANGQDLTTPWFFGSECDGAFAEYSKVDSQHAHRIDSDLTDVELASFPCSYSTAENLLTRCGTGEGDTVLITGASGGVGSAAVQLARARGARVIAITNPAKQAELEALGAYRTLTRDADLVAELGRDSVDVVVDLVAGPGWPPLLDVLKRHGRYGVSGAVGGPIVELDVRTLYLKDLSFFGCTALDADVFAGLVKRIEEGQIKPLVAATFPLEEINAAQEAFAKKGYVGKIVLTL